MSGNGLHDPLICTATLRAGHARPLRRGVVGARPLAVCSRRSGKRSCGRDTGTGFCHLRVPIGFRFHMMAHQLVPESVAALQSPCLPALVEMYYFDQTRTMNGFRRLLRGDQLRGAGVKERPERQLYRAPRRSATSRSISRRLRGFRPEAAIRSLIFRKSRPSFEATAVEGRPFRLATGVSLVRAMVQW
jgi:hypothetical protein